MRLDVLRRLQLPASPPSFLLRAAWKYGVAVGVAAVVLTAGGVDRVPPNGHALATSVLPTTVPCGTIATDLSKMQQQVQELTRASSMLKLQLRDALVKLNVARAVGDQPDWSLLLQLLAKLTDEQTVFRSAHLESASESRNSCETQRRPSGTGGTFPKKKAGS